MTDGQALFPSQFCKGWPKADFFKEKCLQTKSLENLTQKFEHFDEIYSSDLEGRPILKALIIYCTVLKWSTSVLRVRTNLVQMFIRFFKPGRTGS
jgi:hypothetical protein